MPSSPKYTKSDDYILLIADQSAVGLATAEGRLCRGSFVMSSCLWHIDIPSDDRQHLCPKVGGTTPSRRSGHLKAKSVEYVA